MSIGFLAERDHWRAEAERLKAENDRLRAAIRTVAGSLDGWADQVKAHAGSPSALALELMADCLRRALDPPRANENGPAPPG